MRPTMSRGSPKPPYFVQDGSGNEPLKGFGGGPGFDSWRESETTRPAGDESASRVPVLGETARHLEVGETVPGRYLDLSTVRRSYSLIT
jgi:hypothetical protein